MGSNQFRFFLAVAEDARNTQTSTTSGITQTTGNAKLLSFIGVFANNRNKYLSQDSTHNK